MADQLSRALRNVRRRHDVVLADRAELIRRAADAGKSLREIADLVGLSHERVRQIIHGK